PPPPGFNRYLPLMEIKSLLSFFGGHIPSEDIARNFTKWTVYDHGQSPKELYSSLKNYPVDKMVPFLHSDSTYKIKIHTFNKTDTRREKSSEQMHLNKPQHTFSVLEDHGLDPNCIPENPHNNYFGRWIADARIELIESYSVKKRHFVGNTSMDAGLSFIMANHGKVKENDIVFDLSVEAAVYCGLLIACAHFGAYVYGTDINHNIAHGLGMASRKNQIWRGPDENIRANLCQYGLEKYDLEVLVSDASKPSWREGTYFDPPCGIRESTRRTGSLKEIPNEIEKCPESHIPVSLSYHLSDMFFDLLNFSAETLVVGGRLVYWLLMYIPEYTEEMVPWHPCLKLISNCEQKLSSHTSRCLITMEMVKKFENCDRYSHLQSDHFLPYQGHNSFREKCFSGVTERIAKEEQSSQE
uniref:tRNA (guanine(10)-N(2))-methyltransferase TRMT11 n=1 Tax=Nomascus leucogenys TaxID=61853 RepID=A0A2I3H8M1_NOMLE